MKRKIGMMSALLGMLCLGTLSVDAQSFPSEVTVFASATAQSDANGQVAVEAEETTMPTYKDLTAEGVFEAKGSTLMQALPAGGLYVYAYYYARANDGYYFDHWIKSETGETFSEMPRKDSVLSSGTTSNFDGTGKEYFFPFENTYKTSYQSIGTYTAIFKAIPVYSCTSGQLVYASEGENKEWEVTFSTGFARSLQDFTSPEFSNVTAGGSFDADWSGAEFTDNDVVIPVSFTASVEGTYTADMTFSSVGGGSFKATIKVVVEAIAANDVMVKNGTKKLVLSWSDGMSQSVSGDTIQLLRDLTLGSTEAVSKDVTIDLNGRELSGKLDVSGDVTIMDSKMVGRIVSAGNAVAVSAGGSLTLKRGEIIGETAVSVSAGGSFYFVDGILTATTTGIYNDGTVQMKSGEINVSSTSAAAGIQVSGGSVSLEGGKITASVSGASGRGVVVSAGTLNAHNVTIKATGTSPVAMDVIGGTVSLGQYAVLSASTGGYGSAVALKAGSEVTIDGARFSAKNTDGNMQEVNNSSNKVTLVSGYFVVNDFVNSYTLAANQTIYNIGAGQAYTDGYRYFVGTSENAKDNAVSVCAIGTTAYGTLEEALLYAQNNPSEVLTIVMLNNYTLPAGYYTLPANATLLVPASDSQKKAFGGKVSRSLNTMPHAENRRLTLAAGAHLDVYGTVEASGYQYCGQVMQPGSSATSTGSYGLISLNSGSTMTLEDGATIYAWGYIVGDGEIHARRGSQVREFFQVYDWPGAGNAFTIYKQSGEKRLFPLNQYFIQNIEAATVYHPGSRLYTSFAATGAGITAAADNIQIVGLTGENAMYLMDAAADAENTWVRKWYDVANDKQVYDVNSGAHLGSMVIALPMLQAMGMSSFDSKLFVLPLTSNMKIHLLTGEMDITQSTQMLPGTEIEVDKEATVTVNPNVSLYMYDTDQWDLYARNAYAQVIGFTPSWNGQPTVRDVSSLEAIGDAKLNVHGTFDIKGRLLTTTSGANIFSTNADAGTVRFTSAAPASVDDKLYQWKGGFKEIATIPALLRNNAGQDPEFANSAETPAGQAYCFVEDRWRMMTDADPFVYDNYGAWYIKPGAFVSIATRASEKEPIGTEPRINADHTYSDAAGDGRLFILVDNQWWEVTLINNMYRGTNGKYYVYDDNDGAYDEPRWHERQFSVQFVNWDGSDIATSEADATVYDLSYGTMPFYNGTNPTRAEDVDYTYTFTGWMPKFVPVTEDATYTATYEATQRRYTIIFLDETGKEIERHFMTRDEMPECKNTPSKTGHFLTWTPGIGAVTGDQTYQAVFTPEPPTEFTITFKNYDGSELQTFLNVKEGTKLAGLYSGTPSKPASTEYTYKFVGWQPEITAETVAEKDMSFTAQYTTARKFAVVTFEDEKGNPIEKPQNVEIGQTPVAPEYTKDANAEYTYTVKWVPAIATVVSEAPVTYSAEVTAEKNKYTVKVTAENCTVIGAGTYEYGASVTLSVVPAEGYVAVKWNDNTTGNKTFTVTGDVTLTATGTKDDEPDTPDTPEEPESKVVSINDVVTIEESTTYADLTIEASATAAGQIIGAENIKIAAGGNVYYKYVFNAAATTWYDFAVPFECVGATVKAGNKTLTLGKDYHIISFIGATRATIADEDAKTDNSAWEFLSTTADKTLVPGRLYMIYFFSAQNDVTFTKKAGAGIVYKGTVSVNTYDNGGAATEKAKNWNGIANWKLYTAQLNAGTVVYGQFYQPESNSYEVRELANEHFYVGKPVFVQVESSAMVSAQPFASGAPVRRMSEENSECVVTLSDNTMMTDRVYLHTSEDALDEYVIGQDLAKVSVSGKVAQMWVNRYNSKLCVNTIATGENEISEYPLGIFAPQAGAYTIAAPQSEAGTQVVLMYNGVEVADLTRGDYTLDLARGTTTAYAIRVIGKRGMPTAIDETGAGNADVQKVIRNGVLYIVREGKLYDAQGREMK